MRALVLIVLAVSLAACGSDSSSGGAAAPPPAPPAPEPSGNPTTAQPSTSPSQPTSPPPTTPQPDRFVTIERLDPNAECDALVPSNVPAPVTIKVDPAGTGCGRGVSEGTGHVAAQSLFTPRGTEHQVFGPDGKLEKTFTLTAELWPQPEGWQGAVASTSGIPSTVSLLTFFADGSPRRSERPEPSGFSARGTTVAPDPLGGSLVVLWGLTGTGDCFGEARRFDATGAPAGGAGRTACFVFASGVSRAGEALVLETAPNGSTALRWLRPDGTPARPPTGEAFRPTGPLLPLLDGSLVVMESGAYTRAYPHLGTASEPAPAWLTARTNQTFRFTRGNKGYAFFPQPAQNSPDCTQVVELVAPSGRRCAKLTFRRDGNACVTGSIDQGWDGTVVQQASIGACGWRFWPGLLAGG